jgi:hypothetical protein
MNDSQKFELFTALFCELANSIYVEGLSPKEKSNSMSNSNDINIEIKQINGLADIYVSYFWENQFGRNEEYLKIIKYNLDSGAFYNLKI